MLVEENSSWSFRFSELSMQKMSLYIRPTTLVRRSSSPSVEKNFRYCLENFNVLKLNNRAVLDHPIPINLNF